ncbi:MAG: NAD(+)/NADH kinase [Calditrichota bacterium]
MAQTFGVTVNTNKKLFGNKLPDFLEWFRKNNVDIIFDERIPADYQIDVSPFNTLPKSQLVKEVDMLLAFGGDGTILHSVQMIGALETPILGINVGGLGFMTEITLEDFCQRFHPITKGEYNIESRLMLRGDIVGDDKPLYALNEMVIEKGGSVRVIQVHTEVNGCYLNSYVSDGLIISTPTGSTGYSLSSGGPIVVPNNDVMIINPICPHSLTNRPIILSASSTICAKTRTEHPEFIIAADGQDLRHCKTRTAVTIKRAEFCAQLVKPLDSNFYTLLHDKLDWGKDLRDKSRWSHDS